MGAVSGLLGFGGGASGTGFAGPHGAPIVNPVTQEQLSGAYSGVQGGMTAQQQLLQALQGQQGIQNQSNVYGQLQNIAAGKGPNPAQAMLNQSTGQNVANQAALMAGQRGANQNVGMIARQAAQQGAGIQQQAAGQAATLQAQQSLGAIGEAGNMANNQAANQIGQTNANTAAQQAEQQALLNAQTSYNQAQVGMQSNINNANAGLAQTTMQGQQGIIGNLFNAVGFGSSLPKAEGGEIPNMAGGGDASAFHGQGPQSRFGQFLSSTSAGSAPDIGTPNFVTGVSSIQGGLGGNIKNKGAPAGGSGGGGTAGVATPINAPMTQGNYIVPGMSSGGMVPVKLSPGEIKLTPEQVQQVVNGASPSKVGEKIKGKLNVGGAVNSYANDTVNKSVPPHSIIIPRSETKSKNPDSNSRKFVQAVIAKRKTKR